MHSVLLKKLYSIKQAIWGYGETVGLCKAMQGLATKMVTNAYDQKSFFASLF